MTNIPSFGAIPAQGRRVGTMRGGLVVRVSLVVAMVLGGSPAGVHAEEASFELRETPDGGSVDHLRIRNGHDLTVRLHLPEE